MYLCSYVSWFICPPFGLISLPFFESGLALEFFGFISEVLPFLILGVCELGVVILTRYIVYDFIPAGPYIWTPSNLFLLISLYLASLIPPAHSRLRMPTTSLSLKVDPSHSSARV